MMERKFLGDGFEVTAERKVAGYASVFNAVDDGGDTVFPGAYRDTLEQIKARRGLQMRLDHKPIVIGRWTNLEEDQKGLRVEGELTPGHSVADDAYASIKAGHMPGLSIGFRVAPGGAERRSDGGRNLKKVNLFEVSVVADPMDPLALISEIKAADMQPREFRDFLRDAMRDAGCSLSRNEAEALVEHGFKGLIAMRDAGGRLETGAIQTALIEAIRQARS